MNNNIQTQTQNQNSNEENSMTSLQEIFHAYVENGGNPSVSHFRSFLNEMINEEIKHLCSRSGKTPDGNNWKTEINSRFSGRGAKWVFVSLEEIEPTLLQLESQGIDLTDYRKWTSEQNKAWIRYTTARSVNNQNCAGFAVLNEGSTINKPTQLHFIDVSRLDETIEQMPGTPKSLKLEEDSAPMPKASKPKTTPTVKTQTQLEEVYNDFNDDESLNEENHTELNEVPESNDPAEWEAFLAAEGLVNLDDEIDDDIFA